jgi:hypothetical protein
MLKTVGTLRFAHPTNFLRHCERSEAIHLSACCGMDCFVASLLAMTMLNQRGTISATFSAGGVFRLRWVRTMPSMMVMPMPGRSPS